MRTYFASGHVVAERDSSEAEAKAALEVELRVYAGKPVGVIVRTGGEISEVIAINPFSDRAARQTVAILLGVGRSKLRIPAARNGTARNLNTLAKLAAMGAE